MEINELMKKIRLEHNYTYRKIAEKTGFSTGFINDVEKGRANMSDNLFEAYIREFPLYKSELIKAYSHQKSLVFNVYTGTKLEDITSKVSFFKFKVYNFFPKEDGRVDLNNFSEVEFMQTNENGNLILKNGFVFKICDNSLEPVFLLGDNLVFLKETFERWEKFDGKIIIVKIENDFYIGKLLFEFGTPFLFPLNERVYPKLQISEYKKVSFVAILDRRLEQNLRHLSF
jgi:transcriptional regulator with XRE-family HTH domain